ncbi:sulfatase family protein [Tichowtungia aerotolerans]|uniref:Sulfatase-like hydrolase/transferase n=1 Tax=Tichowtungia aerotolerans TaxID=2697043 RepID=A0A6P1MBE0_9BACT|nr:arylsulfatase [Tichowtungia aerotolerans]QHI69408.1 sulfatase-like hydrolase/transferase [Tichowtungia aerotolerans]
MKTPNIIFMMADDMGIGDLGCCGAEKIPTPNMDRLAKEGMRFTDAHSSSAVCTPSRYSVMTGRYCWRTRLKKFVIGGFGAPLIEPERETLGSLCKKAGYTTAAIGKWHMGFTWYDKTGAPLQVPECDALDVDGFYVDYVRGISGGPTELGFDYYYGIAGSLDMPPYVLIENDQMVELPDREKEVYYNQQRRGLQMPGFKDEEVDVTFAKKAAAYIEEQAGSEQPFFLYMTPASPHRPCDIRPEFVKDKSDAGDRGDMVVLFDWMVGQVLGALDRTGQAENTLIVVTSDNGARVVCANGEDYGHKANSIYRGQKADIWDGGHREPFLVRWPGVVEPDTTTGALACLSDFFATVGDIVGQDASCAEDSISLLPVLKGEQAVTRETLIHHSGFGMFSLRKGDWKLVLGSGSGGFTEPVGEISEHAGQLYNLKDDPSEQTNLWNEHAGIVRRLKDEFVDLMT